MGRIPANITRVRNPLKKALYGRKIDRDTAVARAEQQVESLREDYIADLARKVELIEQLAGTGPQIAEDALNELAVLSPVIFNLAGAFGYPLLQQIAASLYDMLVVTAGMDLSCKALVLVHARAAKLAAPGMPEISEEEAENLLRELRYATLFVSDQTKPCRAECSACTLHVEGLG